ncbi:MAG: hypothetical protein E2O82_05100 [Betaproteobacteria bacterium]|nr:MAG: hypothetical protein E2O82_05100 [Betaproteobacteria bacterium]
MESSAVKIAPIYGLVRDRYGRPKIDDGEDMPMEAQLKMLTEQEIEDLKNDRYAFRPSPQ